MLVLNYGVVVCMADWFVIVLDIAHVGGCTLDLNAKGLVRSFLVGSCESFVFDVSN